MRKWMLAAAVIPSVVSGQTVTTNCTSYVPNQVQCQSQGSGFQPPVQFDPNAYSSLINSTPKPIDYAAFAAQMRAKKAGQMVAAGDCDGAERYALSFGDMTLAAQVKAICSK